MDTIYLAQLETRNFQFEGVGSTEQEARDALARAISAHIREYQCTAESREYFRDCLSGDAVEIRSIRLGAGYRDREELGSMKTKKRSK